MKRAKTGKDDVRIRISGLSQGIHEYHLSCEPAMVGLDGNFREAIETHARLEKMVRQLYLQTEIATTAHFQCDRCLEEFEQAVRAGYSMVYTFDEAGAVPHAPDEVHVITPETAFIDLADDIRQVVTLAVPLKLLCSEACKGLCPKCGTNLNRAACDCTVKFKDPRWIDLENLLNH